MGRFTNYCLSLAACLVLVSTAQGQTKVFPLQNGKMTTNLDANGFQITNLDTSNLTIPNGIYQPLDADLTIISSNNHNAITDPWVQTFGVGLLGTTDLANFWNYIGYHPPKALPTPTPSATPSVPPTGKKFVTGYNADTGDFNTDSPDTSDLSGVVGITQGGTGQVTASAALNALLPDQTGHAGQVITTNGTTTSWTSPSLAAGTAQKIATLTSKTISNVADPTDGQVLAFNAGSDRWEPVNVASAATGTVSSVAVGNLAPLFTTVVSNSTSTPSAAFTLTNAAAHTVFGNPTIASAAPVYFTMNIASLADAGNLASWAPKTAPTGTVADLSSTQTFTNKTIDAATNVVKTKKYLDLGKPTRTGDAAKITIDTKSAYSYEARFSNSQPASTNWTEYHFMVPQDLDGTVDLVVNFKFSLYLSDSLGQRYIFSIADIGQSDNIEKVPVSPVTLDFAGDQNGDNGVVEGVTGTLTGWRSILKPGHLAVLRVARDGGATQDPSQIDTTTAGLQIEYGSTE